MVGCLLIGPLASQIGYVKTFTCCQRTVTDASRAAQQQVNDPSRLAPGRFVQLTGCDPRRHNATAAPCWGRPWRGWDVGYGLSSLKRVPQLPSAVRVPPQLPTGAANHCASVQVWLMYSEAIQIEVPSATAAP
jgi:hypothetical protein